VFGFRGHARLARGEYNKFSPQFLGKAGEAFTAPTIAFTLRALAFLDTHAHFAGFHRQTVKATRTLISILRENLRDVYRALTRIQYERAPAANDVVHAWVFEHAAYLM
jgi:hypothetical protein